MELQQYADRFRQQGLTVFAITYDSQEILTDFAKRRSITIPLLADPKSEVIRAFGVLNTSVPAGHLWAGVPYPGTFIVDQHGVVKSKYFESHYADRYSAPTILYREFGSGTGTRQTTVKNDYLELNYYSTRDTIHPGLRFTLVAEFNLPAKMHIYAPEVKGYIPIHMEIDASPYYKFIPAEYPKSEMLHLPAIQETVPVYHDKFRITQDLVAAAGNALQPVIAAGGELRITGKLRYQACDDKICYLPEMLPLEWKLRVEPLDRDRVPEALQHKPAPAGTR